jgi:hypothetical protein
MMALHWYPELRSRMERRLLDSYHDQLISHSAAGYDRRALQEDSTTQRAKRSGIRYFTFGGK